MPLTGNGEGFLLDVDMTDKIVLFPSPPKPEIKAPLSITDVENIGFLTKTDRDLWVKRPEDIIKIMMFIVK